MHACMHARTQWLSHTSGFRWCSQKLHDGWMVTCLGSELVRRVQRLNIPLIGLLHADTADVLHKLSALPVRTLCDWIWLHSPRLIHNFSSYNSWNKLWLLATKMHLQTRFSRVAFEVLQPFSILRRCSPVGLQGLRPQPAYGLRGETQLKRDGKSFFRCCSRDLDWQSQRGYRAAETWTDYFRTWRIVLTKNRICTKIEK